MKNQIYLSENFSKRNLKISAGLFMLSMLLASLLCFQNSINIHSWINKSFLSRIHHNSVYPDAIIIGVRKSGTFALLQFLSLHPDIVVAENELEFFSKYYSKGLGYYLKQLPKRERLSQVLMEKTPAYFRWPNAAQRMLEMRKDLKVILIVREPVERMVSQYLHKDVRDGRTNKSFEVSLKR